MLRRYLIQTLVVIAIVGIALFVVFSLRQSRTRAIEMRIVGGLQQVSAALSNVSRRGEPLPPPVFFDKNGKELYSWRLKVLALISGFPVDIDLTKPWNVPPNEAFSKYPVYYYCIKEMNQSHPADTNILAIAGKDTAFDPARSTTSPQLCSNVLLLMEASNSNVNWMEPGDYKVEVLATREGKISDFVHPLVDNRVHVLFADGDVWAISGDAPVERLKPFFTIDGARSRAREKDLTEYCLERWKSPGVVTNTDTR
jgi:type II secretory pathway pseudopilin PulG